MRTFLIIALTVLSFTASAAQLTCGSTKASHKRTYPINAAAIKIVAKLGLKTCTGTSSKRFADKVKADKHTVKFVVVSKTQLIKAKNDLIKLGGSNGPSL